MAAAACLGGCTRFYAKWADEVAGKSITGGQLRALGKKHDFDVKYSPFAVDAKNKTMRIGKKIITIGKGNPIKLTLDECLEIAFRSSRDFQDRKEDLFSDALAVANGRRSWDWPLAGLDLDGDLDHSKVHAGSETAAGTGDSDLTITQRFINGGVFTLAMALDTATDFVTWHSYTFGSLLDASFTQPLLRGAGTGLAYETQYRLERDFVLRVFDYERFTQTFATGIVTQYYAVLRHHNALENERASMKGVMQTFRLTTVLVEDGQASRIEQDQAEQTLLTAQVNLERLEETYQNALDAFKISLALPVTADVVEDYPAALDALRKAGPKDVPFKEDQAISVAMSVRPDLLTQRATTRDAQRDVEIAADDFFPQLDLTIGLNADDSGADRSARLRWRDHERTAGMTFQYSLDQTDNRDAYRNAMLAAAQAKRELAEFEDNIRLAVRQSYRSLVQSRRSYGLRLRSVEIARRRRKLAVLQQKEGMVDADEVLRAENDLRTAQNGQTEALVSYTTTRLNFLANLGMIEIKEKGAINEREQPIKFERIRKRYTYVGGE